MDDNVRKSLAAAHGLDPEQATEEQVNAAVLAAAPNPDPAQPEPAPATETFPESQPSAPVVPTPAPAPAQTSADNLHPLVPVAPEERVMETLQQQVAAQSAQIAQLEADRASREQSDTAVRRDQLVAAAVGDGRISRPDAEAHYRPLLDIDEKRGSDLLAALTPSRVTVLQRGDMAASSASAAGSDGLLAATLNRLGVRKEG